MGNIISDAVKSVSKGVSSAFKNISKDPIGTLTLGGLSTNAILKGIGLDPINFTQAALMGATGFLVGGPIGAAAGMGLSVAQQGVFGRNIQDIATMGASAQVRYQQQMANAYNKAQQEQANIAKLQNEQNLLQQIRAARIARSMAATDYAGETGVISSGALGNLGSIGSQYLSNLGYSVKTGLAANAYQTYMNQYNWYQTQAQNSQIRWQNRMNMIKTGLSLYGMGDNLATGQLQNYYARLRNADAWADVGSAQSAEAAVPTSWMGMYLSK